MNFFFLGGGGGGGGGVRLDTTVQSQITKHTSFTTVSSTTDTNGYICPIVPYFVSICYNTVSGLSVEEKQTPGDCAEVSHDTFTDGMGQEGTELGLSSCIIELLLSF